MSDYWETRYQNGGSSGSGSVGLSRLVKWRIINKFVDVNTSSVIDVGCGDLSFWKGKSCNYYTGIEMSRTRFEKNKKLKPNFNFINANAADYQDIPKADVVFCFDMLFHIMNDEDYKNILNNLVKYSKKYIFIYTWHKNPLGDSYTDGEYQKYRNFDKYITGIQESGFKLMEVKNTPKFINPFGAMWVFKKQ